MSNWENFKKQGHVDPQEAAPVGRKVNGNFICQICDEYVDDGMYYPTDSVLKWVCENGHASFSENFRIG